jgi:glycosyltransferase involved in cell wall biosynthesis
MASPGDERTRVLFLNTATLPPLGADTWIHVQIMRQLDRATHELFAACAFGPEEARTPTYAALREITDLTLVPADLGRESAARTGRLRAVHGLLDIGRAAGTIVRLARLIRRHDIRVIHTSDRPRDALAAVVLGRLTGATSLVHVHVGYNADWMGRLLRWSLHHATGLIAISEYVAGTLTDAGIDPRRVHVVLNGIDPDEWHPDAGAADARASLDVGPDARLLLTICRLFPQKGPGDVITALARLRDRFPGLMLLIVGTDITPDGWFSAALRERVAELGLVDHVRFLGRRADIEGLMAAAEVFVMPSVEEPFGLVFCEAMAMERPVVALADGGTPEVVEHGRTGLLSPRGDLDSLTANLATLLADPSAGAAMGAAGRSDVLSRFTTARMAADVASVYQAVTCRDPVAGMRGWPRANAVARRESRDRGMDVLERPTVDEFRAAMDTDGYIVIRGVVAPEPLTDIAAALHAEYEQLRSSADMFAGGGSISGHLNCFPGEQTRFVWDAVKAAGVQELVRAIRPDIADSIRATMNFNLPGSVAQHYHTDGLYTKDFLICNIAVVDTDLGNGAIDVLPGTHREFYKFWRYAYHRLYRLSTRVPLRQGDVIIRRSTVWHRGMPNTSAVPRPMMAITFGEMDDLDADPFAVNDGKPLFFPNWYNTNTLGQLREKTFVRAPITYSAWRFARSLYGNKGYSSF